MEFGTLFPERNRFYERRLPGGGYIAIEVEPVRTLFGGVKVRGEIVVERRNEARRKGHRAPIAVAIERARTEDAVTALLPFARSDDALAEVVGRRVTASVTAGRLRLPPS